LAAASGNGISGDSANRLIGQSDAVLGCGAKGSSLSALLPLVTVSAGSNASYSIAVTPSGGFDDAVSLSCTGAPQGASCDISSQSGNIGWSKPDLCDSNRIDDFSSITLCWSDRRIAYFGRRKTDMAFATPDSCTGNCHTTKRKNPVLDFGVFRSNDAIEYRRMRRR